MKIKHYKILTLLSVGFITSLTTAPSLNDVYGALTAPASFDLNYRYDGADLDGFTLGTTSYGTSINVGYTRTADGVYYNYTNTSNHSTHPSIIPNGLSITSTFNRSNTTWVAVDGLYYAEDSKIGSNNTVGTVDNKVYLKFDNNTNKNYRLFLDISSQVADSAYWVMTQQFAGTNYDIHIYENTVFLTKTNMKQIVIPAYSNFIVRKQTVSGSHYLDAWYLKDLGVSASYDVGYDAGYEVGEDDGYADGLGNNPNVLLNGFQAMVGVLVNFMLMIVNLEVFGVSLINVFSILALFVGIVWILKIIRG
jgi:hypothetical protein